MTIKKRFTVSVLIVVIFIMSLSGIIRIKNTAEDITNDMEIKSTITTELVALSLSDSLWNYNDEGMQAIGDALFQDPDICLVSVKNNRGREIYKKNNENHIEHNKDLVYVEKEIMKNNLMLGAVTIGFSTEQGKVALRKEIISTMISISGMAFILWLLITVISNMVTKPIYELSEGAEEIAKGNLQKRLQVNFDDEVGGLAKKFNMMAENMYNMMRELEMKNQSLEVEIANGNLTQKALMISDEKLRYAYANLEVKVEERTQELFAMNQELTAMNEIFQNEIAERKRAEEELGQKNLELEDAYGELENAQSQVIQQEKMASIGQLAAGVAHEINNPIGFIISNLDSLRGYTSKVAKFLKMQEHAVNELAKSCGTESATLISEINEAKRALKIDYIIHDTEDLLDETLDGAGRVKNIVQGLKGFARMNNESMLANINEGIESTMNIIWNEIKYKATLVKDLGNIPLTKCNPGQLNQVFMNILVNAAQAIEVKGDIHVKTWADDHHIFILIRDTGSGISQDALSKIFDPFYTTKEVGKGTGLGLSISYDIIKKHGGEIKVESEVGEGTTFIIQIPIIEE